MRPDHSMTMAHRIAAVLALGLLASCAPSDGRGDASSQPERTAPTLEADPPAAVHAQARLPEDFPTQFPLPPDFEVTDGSFTPGDAMTQASFLVRGHSETGVAEVAAFFEQGLADAGFELLQAAPVSEGAGSALIYFRGQGFRDCSVQLSAAAERTDVIISLPLAD